jgi:RNA polymerase sigma-70 factor, ECF subfamily
MTLNGLVIRSGAVLRIAGMSIDPQEATDEVLVVAVGRRHQHALAEIYRRHGGPLYRLALRILNDRRRAEDVVQDVLVRFWDEPERFDPTRGSLRSWLLMKTHTRAVDVLRSETARRTREERILNDASNEGFDLEREVWDLAVADRVQQAMGTLPVNERQAIALAYFGGHTYREVAQLLGEPEGTVKSRIRSGLRTLRRALHDVAREQQLGTAAVSDRDTGSLGWGS